MSQYSPQYRLTLYAPRSEDNTETTILTPIAGAGHSDEFRIATTWLENLITYSQDGTHWAGTATITPDDDTAPDGTTTAIKIEDTSAAAAQYAGPAPYPSIPEQSGSYVSSRYFKKNTRNYAPYLEMIFGGAGANPSHYITAAVNMESGEIEYSNSNLARDWRVWVQDAGDYWRVHFMGETDGTHDRISSNFYPARWNLSTSGFDSALIGYQHCWGAQIVSGSAPKAYTKTTDSALYYPGYLHLPRGRRGKLDPIKKKMDTGWLQFTIQDQRITAGGDNADRWLTAFVGNDDGVMRLHTCKAYVEESLDGGSTWNSFFTGRVHRIETDGKIKVVLNIREFGEEFDSYKVFVGTPHKSIDYATIGNLVPLGLDIDFGGNAGVPLLTGSINVPQTKHYNQDSRLVRINRSRIRGEYALLDTLTTQWDRSKLRIPLMTIYRLNPNSHYRVAVEMASGAKAGLTGSYQFDGSTTGDTLLEEFHIAELPESDPDYLPIESASLGESMWFSIYDSQVRSLETGKSSTQILIDDVNPATMLADLCDGKYGYLWDDKAPIPAGVVYGDPKWTFPYNSASLAALAGNFFSKNVTARFIIDEEEKLAEFVEKQLCEPFNFCYFWNADGELEVKDLNRPTSSVSVDMITEADLVAGSEVSQTSNKKDAISTYKGKFYIDAPIPQDINEFNRIDKYFIDAPSTLIETEEQEYQTIIQKSVGLGDNAYSIDAKGYRAFLSERFESAEAGAEELQRKKEVLEGRFEELFAKELAPVFGYAPTYYTLPARRTTNTSDCFVGSLRLLNIPQILNPTTNTRGGVRIARCVAREENGPVLNLSFLDLGSGSVAQSVFNAGTMYTSSAEPYHTYRFDSVVPDTAGDRIGFYMAVTERSEGTRPAADSDRWTMIGSKVLNNTGSFLYRLAPSGKRIWGAVQTIDPVAETLLPSAWSYPSPDHVDTKVLPAPTGLSISNQTGGTADLSWTVPSDSAGSDIEIYLGAGSSAPLSAMVQIDKISPNSTEYLLSGLVTSSAYTAAVRFTDVDGLGGVSPTGSVNFSTTATYTQCPRIANLVVV